MGFTPLIKQERNRMATSQYTKGRSGNLAGRPPGKTPGAKLRKAIERQSDSILQAAIAAAIDGNMMACKMLLDRITPPLQPMSLPIAFDNAGNDPSTISQAIIGKMARGEVTPESANLAMAALSHQCKIFDIVHLTKEIDELKLRLDSK